MIFARRALQRRVVDLRESLETTAVDRLVAQLNHAGRGRLAAMWEVSVLHALTRQGSLRYEMPIPSGCRPDIFFDDSDLQLTADITTVSDEGLDEGNPYFELSKLIEDAKTKLGLPVGGVDLSVKSNRVQSARGSKTTLRLPLRKQLQKFVYTEVVPLLRQQISEGKEVLRVSINDDEVGIELTINPVRSPYSSGSFAAYDVPRMKDRNPLYNALRAKVEQLRGAVGITGVIACDGDCRALAARQPDWDSVSAESIAQEFLRQYSSIDFVLFLTIRESDQPYFLPSKPPTRWVHPTLTVREGCAVQSQLQTLFTTMIADIPKPVAMPVNGAHRAREDGYGLGYHGGYRMGGRKIRVSSRELMEVLAGLRTFEDNGALNVDVARRGPRKPSSIQNAFLQNLKEGRLPMSITVAETDENDSDDWVEFEFGDPDPAISPIR